jgi:hypothetical protein
MCFKWDKSVGELRRWGGGVRKLLLLALAAAAVGLALLAFHPSTGPEVRSYLRDRYLRPGARLPL